MKKHLVIPVVALLTGLAAHAQTGSHAAVRHGPVVQEKVVAALEVKQALQDEFMMNDMMVTSN